MGATLTKYGEICEGMLVVFSDRSAIHDEVNNEADQLRSAEISGFRKENVKLIDQLGLGLKRMSICFFAAEKNRDDIRIVIH